jgi:hypothetical protein
MSLQSSLPNSPPSARDKRKPQTSHGGCVRCRSESGIQVWKGCLMSLTVMHETVLHVAQMRPESWEMGGILTGSARRESSALVPSHSGTGNPDDRPSTTRSAERRHDQCLQGNYRDHLELQRRPPAIGPGSS